MAERLQKLISTAGIASRRDAEVLIEQGRVTVNGKKAILGDKADPAVDDVRVDGERITTTAERVYIMLNKPRQVVTAVRSQSQDERDTVRDLVPVEGYLYPVGRLDADSEGLILLTNDGELAQRLTHPRYHHAKIYEVTVHGYMREDVLDIWRRGVVIDDGKTAPVEIKVLRRESRFTQLQVTMHEGRKRQIRRIASTLGFPVDSIVRTHLGTLELGNLKPGEWRYLTDVEVRALRTSAMSGPSVESPNRPGARAGGNQRQTSHRQSKTGYKRGEPGRHDADSRESRPSRRFRAEGDLREPRASRGSYRSRGPSDRAGAPGRSDDDRSRTERPFQNRPSDERRERSVSSGRGDEGSRDRRDRDQGTGSAHPPRREYRHRDQDGRSERTPRSGARRAETSDRGPRGPRDERGPSHDRGSFRPRRGLGPANTERREPRPEGGDRPARAQRPDREQDQRDQTRERSRPPQASRNRPPGRDSARGPRRDSNRGSGRPGGGPSGQRGGQGRHTGDQAGGPSGRSSGGPSGSRGPGSGGRSSGRGPRRGGR